MTEGQDSRWSDLGNSALARELLEREEPAARARVRAWLWMGKKAYRIGGNRMVEPPRPKERDDVTLEAVESAALETWWRKRIAGAEVYPEVEAARALADYRKRKKRRGEHVPLSASLASGCTPLQDIEARERALAPTLERTIFVDVPRLKVATIRVCERSFLKTTGRCWREVLPLVKTLIRDSEAGHNVEKQAAVAHRLVRELNAALAQLPSDCGGPRAHAVRRLRDSLLTNEVFQDLAQVDPTSQDLDVDGQGITVSTMRARVAHLWPLIRPWIDQSIPDPLRAYLESCAAARANRDGIPVALRMDGERRVFEPGPPVAWPTPARVGPTELATVALLLGDWPEGMQLGAGKTPKQVIESVKVGFASKGGAVAQVAHVSANDVSRWRSVSVEKKK